ncbi:MAG: MotA/TolQ/ExbB proton channel family protein [Burkholderiales bacterium]|nr:MotA/TolQ/ExbB proton channel family protein [Burkholderiales bacterium]
MSAMTWYLIMAKAWTWLLVRHRTRRFLGIFWNSPSLQAVETHLEEHHPDEPFSHITWHAIVAARHHQRHGANKLDESGSAGEFLTRSMRRVIDEETARFEAGLTVLASIGSTAPFIGLFGTVWSIYHALINIGMSGQGTLDKVAGPVGEALLMTAAGLAVAIPAVLAYNAMVRSNRLVLARLDSFAHDLFVFLTTGSHVNDVAPVTPVKTASLVKGAA